jgi:hypothetical protein
VSRPAFIASWTPAIVASSTSKGGAVWAGTVAGRWARSGQAARIRQTMERIT